MSLRVKRRVKTLTNNAFTTVENTQIRERVAKLETDVTHVKSEICELRKENKTMNKLIVFLLTVVLGVQGVGLI